MTTTVWAIVLVAAVALIIAGLWLITRGTPPPPPPARHRDVGRARRLSPRDLPLKPESEPAPTAGDLPLEEPVLDEPAPEEDRL